MRTTQFRLFLLLGLLTLLSAILYFNDAWGTEPGKYQTVFYYTWQVTFGLACLIIPLGILLTVFQGWFKAKTGSLRLPILSIVILFSANLIACGATLPFLMSRTTNLQNAYVGNHLYRMDSLFSPGIGGDHTSLLIIWECDNAGWFCQVIEAKDFYEGMNLALQADVQNRVLKLLINHETVYTYTPGP